MGQPGMTKKIKRPSFSVDGAKFCNFFYDSGLINGRGRFYNSIPQSSHPVLYETPLDVIEVEKGQEYRFRVIACGAIYPFRVSVQGHRLGLTASDGFDFEVVPVESVIVNPGERYDFLLTANQTVGNYMIFAETLQIKMPVIPIQLGGQQQDTHTHTHARTHLSLSLSHTHTHTHTHSATHTHHLGVQW